MKIEAKKFYWTKGKEIVYICEADQSQLSYRVLGIFVYPRKSPDLTWSWTLEGTYNWAYPNHRHTLVKEVTDPVLKALYED